VARFSHIAIEGESWFAYRWQFTRKYGKSGTNEKTITRKIAIVTIFFVKTKLPVLEILHCEGKFNQDHILDVFTAFISTLSFVMS
jgi:hypothetical protein